MKTSSKSLFLLMMVMSTIMVLSSNSWINMWIGLEVNLMSFIPLMSKSKNSFLSQSSMMYFLIQSMASMLFITFILINKFMFISLEKNMMKTLIMTTMMMKMGMPPFHMWFPEVMNKLSWMMCYLMMTWQKIAPMYITSLIIEMNKITLMIISISAMIGAIGGINQTSTRKIMAYSSITHMSWMIYCATVYKKSWMMYLIMYMMVMMIMSMMMFMYNIMYINQMNMFFMKKIDKMIIIFMIMNLGGLPPFLGFIPKWITIQYMLSSKEFIIMLIMMVSTLITLSYYMRMSSSMNLIMNSSQKWMYMFTTSSKVSMFMFYINMMLPVLVLLMNFY